MSAAPLILAIGLVNPLLASGLGLAAMPILIHLLSRRRYRRVEWGATLFLLQAEQENRRRVQFEQWLLLALRVLAMIVLALLVARPFVRPGVIAKLLGGRDAARRVLLIDDSASLGFRDGPRSDFAGLREAAGRLVGWLQQEASGQPVSVYLTSRPDAPLAAVEHLDVASAADLRSRIDELRSSDMPAAPRSMLESIRRQSAEQARGVPTDLYIFSDFQRSEWLESDGGRNRVLEPLTQFDRDALRVFLVSSGTQRRENVALRQFELVRPQTIAGLPAMARATVTNYSAVQRTGLKLALEIDGVPLPPAVIDAIDAGQSKAASFEATFPVEGAHELTLDLGEIDGLAADNALHEIISVHAALRVLIVNGSPSPDAARDEAFLPRAALAPPGPFSSGIRVDVVDAGELEGTDLAPYDCVLLANVAPPSEASAAALERYAASGGGVMIFLGDSVGDSTDYNRVLYRGGEGLLPVALRAVHVVPGDGPAVGLIRSGDHPATSMFPAGAEGLSEYVHFRAYYGADEPAATATHPAAGGARAPAAVLARFTDAERSPALIERALGRGRVLLFTSSLDLDWNDWARAVDGSYVVALLEWAQYAARRDQEAANFVTGETLRLSLPADQYEPSATFKSPAYPDDAAVVARISETSVSVGEPFNLEGPAAKRIGRYTAELTRRGGDGETRILAVNANPIESDLAVASSAELSDALGSVRHEYLLAADAFARGESESRREFWPTLLIALAALLVSEQALAWKFGQPPAPRRRAAGRWGGK